MDFVFDRPAWAKGLKRSDLVGKRFRLDSDTELYGGRSTIMGKISKGTLVEIKSIGHTEVFIEIVDFPFGQLGWYTPLISLVPEPETTREIAGDPTGFHRTGEDMGPPAGADPESDRAVTVGAAIRVESTERLALRQIVKIVEDPDDLESAVIDVDRVARDALLHRIARDTLLPERHEGDPR
jgi:hypothetical protein